MKEDGDNIHTKGQNNQIILCYNKDSSKQKSKKSSSKNDYEELEIKTHVYTNDNSSEFVRVEYVQHRKEEGSVFVLSIINYDNLVRKKSYIIIHRSKEQMELL